MMRLLKQKVDRAVLTSAETLSPSTVDSLRQTPFRNEVANICPL